MRKPMNYNTVARSTDTQFEPLPNGGYVCIINEVTDNEDKQMLTINYDIFEGQYKGYFKDAFEALGFWTGTMRVMYDDNHASNIKAFIEDVEASNPNFTFNWANPKCLVRKGIGLILQQEEYEKNNGNIGIRIGSFPHTKTVNQIRQGDFNVPNLKKLKVNNTQASAPTTKSNDFDIMDNDIQF